MATVVFGSYEWDEDKAAANLEKHGVSFVEAASALQDPRAVYVDASTTDEPMPNPSKDSLLEIPELDVKHAKALRRGPRPGRVLKLPLRAMREAAGKTQAEVGASLGSDQAEMSKLERRPDMMLSTLRRYAEALGARCEVTFVFDKTGHRIVLGASDDDE